RTWSLLHAKRMYVAETLDSTSNLGRTARKDIIMTKQTHSRTGKDTADVVSVWRDNQENGNRHLQAAQKSVQRKTEVKENDVKKGVKVIVSGMAPSSFMFWPVQSGYGASDLDLMASVNGFCLRVETKVAGRKPTPRQKLVTEKLTRSGVPVLWIDQNNLTDLAVVLDLLLVGKQGDALEMARLSREEF